VSCARDWTICIWDPVADDGPLVVLRGHFGSVNGVTTYVAANGNVRVVSCGDDGTVRIWEDPGNDELLVLKDSGSILGVTTYVASDDEVRIVSCGADGMVRVWNLRGDVVLVLEGHAASDVAGEHFEVDHYHTFFNPREDKKVSVKGVKTYLTSNGEVRVVSWAHDGTVRLWDASEGGDALQVLKGHGSRDSTYADEPGVIRVVIDDATISGATTYIASNGEARVVSCADDKTVRIWDPDEGRELCHIPLEVECAALCVVDTSDARVLVLGHEGGSFSYWDIL